MPKTYIVSGGASGLGRATCETFFADGHNVAVLDRDDGEAFAAELNASSKRGQQAIYVQVDVTDKESIENAVTKTVDTFGSLNGIVSCAGVGAAGLTVGKRGDPANADMFRMAIEVNLVGTFLLCSIGAAAMSKLPPDANGDRGAIITVASVAGIEGQKGQVPYSASKGGVIGMTLPMARDLGRHGIRVLCICPGIIDTPLMRMAGENVQKGLLASVAGPKRFGHPAEFASLCAEIMRNGYLNGEVLRLDGGIRFSNL